MTIFLFLIRIYISVMFLVYRVLYGVRVEGWENVPRKGPAILCSNEIGQMGNMLTTFVVARLVLSGRMEMPMSFTDEFALTTPHGALFRRYGTWFTVPFGHGQGADVLMSSLKALREGKLLMLNPEADMSWDGRMLRFTPGLAWLALHSAAPVIFIVATYGAYNIWPKWQKSPYLSGRFKVRISRPIYVTNSPQRRVTDEMVHEANQQLMDEMHALVYGDGRPASRLSSSEAEVGSC